MFGVTSKVSKKMTPAQMWNTEWSFYENLLAIDHGGDPLAWWKSYERQLPYLCMKYLLILIRLSF